MKFTVNNLETEVPKVKLDSKMALRWKNIVKPNLDLYDKSENIKRAINLFIRALNQIYDKKTANPPEEKAPTPKKAETAPAKSKNNRSVSPKPKKEKQPRVPKPKKKPKAKPQKPQKPKKPTYQGSFVKKILPSVVFIRRYACFNGKTIGEAKDSAVHLLASLQKAIVEKQIRKTDKYADEINKIQKNLIAITNRTLNNSVVIELENIKRLKEIAASQRVDDSTRIIKQFLAIQGKEGVEEKRAKALLTKVKKIHLKTKNKLLSSLEKYISGRTATIEADTQTLRGLYGLAGAEQPEIKTGSVVNSAQFLGQTFDTIALNRKWAERLGKPTSNFRMMIYGKAGSGKSSFAIKLAAHLSKDLQKKVLYVAGEEKFGYTLQEKLIRFNAANYNLIITDKVPSNQELTKYDVVIFDSVNTLQLSPEALEKMPKNVAYLWLFQCRKDGVYMGAQAYEHNADTVIEITDMQAITRKNRFGGAQQFTF
ncbi:MAG: AAA family ATPase [Prevotellaceae bacterium]|nr:AAA family ATPase [Prevotellaceae bacterium]